MTTLPTITNQQQALLRLIYTYRFLQRNQIQIFMHHTDKRRISAWLKDLRYKHYIEWIYQPDDPIESKRPAIYYLELNGIRYLREHSDYPPEELRKRYTESKRKQSFIDRCLLLADCCINMEIRTADGSGVTYEYVTEADCADPYSDYYFLCESEFVHPNLCYTKEEDTGDELVVTTSLLEVFDTSLPRYTVRKRLKDYVAFLDSDEWQEGTGDTELPIILIVCPTKAELIYAKRRTRQVLADTYGDEDDDIPEDVHIRFATVEKVKELGVTGSVWEEV